MVNPLLTLLVDLVLIGTALFVIGTMIREYLESKTPAVGRRERASAPSVRRPQTMPELGRRQRQERRRVA